MKHYTIESKIEYLPDIPETVYYGLLDLFENSSIGNFSADEKAALKSNIAMLFSSNAPTDYEQYSKAYALYYLPVNLQKIWRPLLDLVLTDSLDKNCNVLELGAGPGSATFGLIEFYKYLAYDNNMTEFSLNITAVEREKAFSDTFKRIYDRYSSSLPYNLKVSVECINDNAFKYLDNCEKDHFNLVLESNMLNPNEHVNPLQLNSFAKSIKSVMKRHSNAIFIEPAKKELVEYLKVLKTALLEIGLSCYSPCCCKNHTCGQFASARLNVSEISVCQELYENEIISKQPVYHAFEYAVFRNDTLKKYNYEGTETELADLAARDGELVKFKAFVLAIAHPEEEMFSLKICDGSRAGAGDVWLNVPKNKLVDKEINSLTCGRGGLIDVKNAVVEGPTQLGFCNKTRIKIFK